MNYVSKIALLSSFALILARQPIPGSAQTAPSAHTHNPQAQAHRDRGDKRLDAADLAGALREYRAAYALDKGKRAYRGDAATDRRDLGDVSIAQGHFLQANSWYRQALTLDQQANEKDAQARDLTNLGIAGNRLGQYPRALIDFQQAITLFQKVKDRSADVIALANMVDSYEGLRQYPKARDCYQQALAFCRTANNEDGEARMLECLGSLSLIAGQPQPGIVSLRKALPLFQKIKDRRGQRDVLRLLANASLQIRQFETALADFQKALAIDQQIHDREGQARMFVGLGISNTQIFRYETALVDFQKALSLFRQTQDAQGEMTVLNQMGNVCEDLSRFQTAAAYFQQGLSLARQGKDTEGQAEALMNLGFAHNDLSQSEQAITAYQQALSLFQQTRDTQGQAASLSGLGIAYDNLSQYQKAIQYYEQAIPLDEANKNQDGAGNALLNLANAYDSLNQYQTAVQYFGRAMPLFQAVQDLHGQVSTLNGMGNVCEELGQYDKAIQAYELILPIYRQLKDRDGEAITLSNLACACEDVHQYDRAIQSFQQAILIHQQVHDRDGEAVDLENMGDVYDDLYEFDAAVRCYNDSLTIYRQVKDRSGEAGDLTDLMDLWEGRANPRLAIFYGKQSVNVYQSIRQDIQTMDKETQKTYLKDKEPTYRSLAELLIAQGRLPEAEQVLGLLKNQEFFDFVRRDPSVSPTAGGAALTPIEATWQARYQVIADHVTVIGQTKADLLTKQQQADAGQITLTPTEKDALRKNLTQADSDLTVANKAFQDFLTQLAAEAQNAPKAAQDRVQTVTDATAFEDTLNQLGPGTVALYTIVEPDKVRILLVTSQTQVAREYPIKDTDLRKKVLAFRQVLQDPTHDPRSLAHDLYAILVGPVENDLTGAKATTLMWSLDDVLRYLPMAALYDGKQYLVERYKNEVFTPASESRLTETPKTQWNGLGLGVSQPHPGFAALTGVLQELDGIIHDPTVTASQTGALPGTILLDTAFTEQTMTQALEARNYPLVHIASHFDFQPGDETASFLLLGDGKHLSLADIKTLPQVFQGVDLLTLSACDTADGNTGADGREVEGFAVLAQRLGAKSVIASLWPVADASTPLLMETFYKQHGAVPGQPKAESLRQAQLSLLHGTVTASANGPSRAEIVPGKSAKSVSDALPFTPDPKAPFAHPYYWAPFILIGNWK